MRMDKYTKALLTFNLLAIGGLSVGWYQQAKIVSERGGARLVVKSGGTLDIESGGEIDVESGGALKLAGTSMTATAAELNATAVTLGSAAASKIVSLDASSNVAGINFADIAKVTNADLIIESLNPLTFNLNDVNALQFDNAAIAAFAAAADTVGNGVYVESEDGGVDTAVDGGSAGGLLAIKTGDGGAGGADQAGAAGGAITIIAGDGSTAGTDGGANPAGGAGAALTIATGTGGAQVDGTGNGGVGGALALTADPGGAAAGGTGDGGAGGGVTITAGAGGTSSGGVAGAPGGVTIAGGVLFQTVQTIDMLNTNVTMTLVPGTPTGTLLTGNIMYVDATSGGTENLLLPPEGDCTGLFLVIENTGGESIIVQNDAGGAVVTLETLNVAYCVCDGTTWTGSVAVP